MLLSIPLLYTIGNKTIVNTVILHIRKQCYCQYRYSTLSETMLLSIPLLYTFGNNAIVNTTPLLYTFGSNAIVSTVTRHIQKQCYCQHRYSTHSETMLSSVPLLYTFGHILRKVKDNRGRLDVIAIIVTVTGHHNSSQSVVKTSLLCSLLVMAAVRSWLTAYARTYTHARTHIDMHTRVHVGTVTHTQAHT